MGVALAEQHYQQQQQRQQQFLLCKYKQCYICSRTTSQPFQPFLTRNIAQGGVGAWVCTPRTFLVRALDNTAWGGMQGVEVAQVRQLHCVVQGGGAVAVLQGSISVVVQQDAHHPRVLLLGRQVEGGPLLVSAGIHLCSSLHVNMQQTLAMGSQVPDSRCVGQRTRCGPLASCRIDLCTKPTAVGRALHSTVLQPCQNWEVMAVLNGVKQTAKEPRCERPLTGETSCTMIRSILQVCQTRQTSAF